MQLSEIFDIAYRYINEKSVNGTDISDTNGNYIDIKKRMYGPANASQMRLAGFVKIPDIYSISQNPITNLLGIQGFNEVQHFPGDNKTYTSTGAKSFSIEVDKPCVISFDESVSGVWTPLEGTYYDGDSTQAFSGSITVTGISKYTNYRGLLTIASASNLIRITVVATYPMKSRYRALFQYPYASANDVPWYRAYIEYSLPADYWQFNKMMRTYDERQFTENKDYILTSDNKIYINWHLTGQFDIHYWKYPTEITPSTSDNYELEVSKECQALMPWFIGGQAIMPDDSSIGIQLLNQYYQMESELSQDMPYTQEESEDTDGW
ncbi:MAG: hypothetical protein N3I35_06735 [Clostridia bacterium]|nr:hypothetical protein [Clostridia bacterium]